MPIYEYECKECRERFEKLVRSTANPPAIECPKCGSDNVQKALSLFGFGMSKGGGLGSSLPAGGSWKRLAPKNLKSLRGRDILSCTKRRRR